MFIIPCRYDPQRPIIFECIDRIQKYHPDEMILVVDSASEEKLYFEALINMGVFVVDAENINYGVNAYSIGFDMFPSEDWYYCIYDSLLLNAPLDKFKDAPFTAMRHFNTPPTGWGWDGGGISLHEWAQRELEPIAMCLGKQFPESFTGILGPMWMCSNEVMHDLDFSAVFDILPQDKYQLCAMERIMGIVLQWLGYDPSNSIQGEMFGFFDEYDETYIQKVHMARW